MNDGLPDGRGFARRAIGLSCALTLPGAGIDPGVPFLMLLELESEQWNWSWA